MLSLPGCLQQQQTPAKRQQTGILTLLLIAGLALGHGYQRSIPLVMDIDPRTMVISGTERGDKENARKMKQKRKIRW